jgi:opacity protein-like surface antigen
VLMPLVANAQGVGLNRIDNGPYVVQSDPSQDAPKPYPLTHEAMPGTNYSTVQGNYPIGPLEHTADKAAPARSWQAGASYDWSGFYLGGHVGAAYGTSTFSDPYGASIYGDSVQTPGFLAGVQGGYNYQTGPWVLGLEADADWMASDGTNTCLAYSGYYISSNCHSHPDALGTLTGRIGYAFGPLGRTLPYVKGGMAWVHNNAEINVNNIWRL